VRIVPALLAALALPLTTLPAATIAEKMAAHDVELAQLVERPHAFKSMRVRFRATFAETAGIFSSYHTRFGSDNYMNVVVWDDDAKVWQPQQRAKPVDTLYFRKQRDGANVVSTLEKYTIVDVVGEVVSDYRGQPWINCHSITRVGNAGSFTDNAIYHLEQAVALHEEDRYVLADEHFESALNESLPVRSRVAIQRLQAAALIDGKDYDKAITALTQALDDLEADERLPLSEKAGLHYLRAKARSELGERLLLEEQDPGELFELAVLDARESLQLEPANGDAYSVLGISLAGLEQFDEAKRQCERAIRLRPDNAEVRWYLGRILDLQEDYDQAIAVLREAIDLAPKDDRLHKAIARSFFNRSNLGGATASDDLVTSLREYDIAIRLNPADPDLYYWSGVVLEAAVERQQKVKIEFNVVEPTYDMAIDRFQTCLETDPEYTEAHVRLGYRFRAKEEHDTATAHFRSAIDIEPHRSALYELLGRYLWDLQRRPDAREVYALYHERDPDHIDTLYALGRLSYELDDYQQAVDWLQELRRQVPEHPLANADLTECYFELDDPRDAVEHADIALAVLEDPSQIIRVLRFKGLAMAAMDYQHDAVAALHGHLEGATDVRMPITLGWALTIYDPRRVRYFDDPPQVENISTVMQELAQQALALQPEHQPAIELLGWSYYLAGNYAKAAEELAKLPVNEPLYAYRLGMALFQQGSAQYAQAKPLLEKGEEFRHRSDLYDEVHSDIRTAQRAIRAHERQVERQRREAERQREREERARQRAEANSE